MGYSDNKPGCYGDEEYFDPDDDECDSCAVKQSCGIRVSRMKKQTNPSYRSTSSQYSKPSTSRQKNEIQRIVEDPEDGVSFGKILMHNTGVEVLQSIVDELSNSIRHVPRMDYGKYFDRKKK